MRKILIFLFSILLLTACNSTTSPKNEVQKLFLNYNSLSSDLLIQLDSVIDSEELTIKEKDKYKEVLKRQYEDLKYKIKDEVVDDDNAVVTVGIEVYNLAKVIKDAEDYMNTNIEQFYIEGKFSNELFWDYKLDKMYNTNERIKYDLELTLTKIDNKWVLDELLESNRQKIHGLFNE